MRSIHDVLGGAGYPDPFTDEDLADLKQEIVRDVTASMMFGAQPAPVGQFPTLHDQASRRLATLSAHLLHHRDAAEHVSQLAHEGIDEDGALRFASLLFLVDEREGARFWWQFSAGVGNATSAYCLHLYHLSRGELRDADHWALQAATCDNPVPRTPTRHQLIHRDALRAAVRALKVDAVEESGYSRVLSPAQHLADRIEELTDAP
ncbi:hypothetical protein ACWGBO_34430 [[Kitasatospora] papulosa]|uniref:Uncharacterized protein n=1 Tax=Streptomyces glycanivorans TaxID=3033808 RepID=A0ABY9JNM6_9ACTN|nr:hypothetical protein [Streptomyces sp. Alt3]WLQ69320.1 hypothetical protein P8A20_38030 [Streptomyces sp. Alt3]